MTSDDMSADQRAYERLLIELDEATTRLQSGDGARIAQEIERLRRMAEEIEDPYWREPALAMAAKLSVYVEGPQPGTSDEYRQAHTIMTGAHQVTGPAEDRLTKLRQAQSDIAALAARAPMAEQGAILRMNSSIERIIVAIQHGVAD